MSTNQPNGRQKFLAAMERQERQFLEPNPLQRALDDYHLMESERDQARVQLAELKVQNGALVAEVSMLRESLERADADRIRLQAISSTLLGRLYAINDTINGAVKAAIRDGLTAAEEADETKIDLEQAGAEAQAIIQRVTPETAPFPPDRPIDPLLTSGVGAATPLPPLSGLMRR